MTIKWGDPIECNGVRPDWLRDDERVWPHEDGKPWQSDMLWHAGEITRWADADHELTAFCVRDDHPAYVALARGFHPWSGGESAPDDWDGGAVLLRGEKECPGHLVTHWGDQLGLSTIIGYRKRVEYGAVHADGSRSGGQPLAPEPVRIVPMTLDEWKTIQFHPGTTAWAHSVGLIRPETTAERFTRETGHAVTEAVEAALNWKGE